MNFPTSKDDATSLPNPNGNSTQNNPDHANLHTQENAAIIAVEGKLGTGATVPAANQLLFGTGAGTSAWQGLTSAQLASILSDETGSGATVFANTPTLITPKVDTINENTLNNGVTVGGVNLKSGVVTGSGAGLTAATVPGAALTNTSVIASKLNTGAQYALVATSQGTGSTSYTDLATVGPAVTVTIGVNGLAFVVINADGANSIANDYSAIAFAISGATTRVAAAPYESFIPSSTAASETKLSYSVLVTGLASGSTTFTLKYKAIVGGTATFLNREISVIPL